MLKRAIGGTLYSPLPFCIVFHFFLTKLLSIVSVLTEQAIVFLVESLSRTLETVLCAPHVLFILGVQYIRESVKWTYWSLCPCVVSPRLLQRTHTFRRFSEPCLFCSSNQTHPLVVRQAGRIKQNKQGCFL